MSRKEIRLEFLRRDLQKKEAERAKLDKECGKIRDEVRELQNELLEEKIKEKIMTGHISTTKIYYVDTYANKFEAKILEMGQDENGSYVIFDKTIFHPQGGGQPADQGYLEVNGKQYNINKLAAPRNPHEESDIIKHYYQGEANFLKEQKVIQVIDMEKRLLYSRLHSAGHLLEDAIRQIFPSLKGIRGNHFPNGQAFVVFTGEIPTNIQESKEKISNLVNELVKKNIAIKIENNSQIRAVKIGDFYPHSCGGTH
ncbi:23548_t:CDS:2 [Entrophospora sp. SA101]|nr:23548_t:CDS:2 [Entrophospora sp. SA101]